MTDAEYMRQWKKTAKGKEAYARQNVRYWRTHPEKSREYHNKRDFDGVALIVLERDNYSCRLCGMTNDQHLERWGKRITIDHIDGKGTNTPYGYKNNDLDNLQTLCLSCHTALEAERRRGYPAPSVNEKSCLVCGSLFLKPYNYSYAQFVTRRFCSRKCSGQFRSKINLSEEK